MVLRGNNLARGADRLVRKVALAADQVVVVGTPVDTGRARSNWIAQVGGPATGVISAYAPGEASTQAAISQASGVIAGYVGGPTSPAIHITNNLPYIQKLNDGYSAQAPAGFVETALATAVTAIAGARLLDG